MKARVEASLENITKIKVFQCILTMFYLIKKQIAQSLLSYLTAAGEGLYAILAQYKLNFTIHILIVDGFAFLEIDATSHLEGFAYSILMYPINSCNVPTW